MSSPIRWFCMIPLMAMCCVGGIASGQDLPDGLVKVHPRKMDLAWLRPGADFRPYTKVIVGTTQVAFYPTWLKDYNLSAGPVDRLSQAQANQIMAAAQSNFDDIFRDAFRKAGYDVVTAPGPDVLRVNSAIVDLMINAPKGDTTGQTIRIITAGQGALIVEVRDSTTNALLGRVADRRTTEDDLGARIATTAVNLADFRQLFKFWAGICANALGELKAVSPIPADLKPNQRL